jgi:hypothetical protein
MAFLSLCSLVGSTRYGFADGTFGVNHLAWRTRANDIRASGLAM